ncbi:MAG: rRNA maturation RNase YbeY [Melioribacteraceae bacterium]|nr:rRNA maturation RNase YbeY [Melioribacteraceae bacterium]
MKNLSVATSNKIKIEKRLVHSLIAKLAEEIGFKLDFLNVNFVDADQLLEINKEYLKHNYHTDIITFNYSRSNNNLEGEIFISINEAITNSLKYKVHLDSEIVRLVVHGILHLVGYDDKESSDKRKMKKEENKLTDLLDKEFKNLLIEYDY